MRDLEIGRVVRALRRRRGWRQADAARRAGVDRSTWSHLESGHLDRMTTGTMRRCLAALEMRLDLVPRWRGAELDRTLDDDHATLQAAWAERLRRWGFQIEVERSFNHYGDRGRIDLLCWHSRLRILLVCEIKSELADAQGLLGPLDVKVRVGPSVAAQMGWGRPARVVPLLIIRESATVRRRLQRLAPLFVRFTHRGRVAASCLRHPERLDGVGGLLILSDLSPAADEHVRRVGKQRVRPRATRASVGTDRLGGSTGAGPA